MEEKKQYCCFCEKEATHSRHLADFKVSIGMCEEHYGLKTLGELYQYMRER